MGFTTFGALRNIRLEINKNYGAMLRVGCANDNVTASSRCRWYKNDDGALWLKCDDLSIGDVIFRIIDNKLTSVSLAFDFGKDGLVLSGVPK
jgi:hypothetical protein